MCSCNVYWVTCVKNLIIRRQSLGFTLLHNCMCLYMWPCLVNDKPAIIWDKDVRYYLKQGIVKYEGLWVWYTSIGGLVVEFMCDYQVMPNTFEWRVHGLYCFIANNKKEWQFEISVMQVHIYPGTYGVSGRRSCTGEGGGYFMVLLSTWGSYPTCKYNTLPVSGLLQTWVCGSILVDHQQLR